jgi:hypothetical protein
MANFTPLHTISAREFAIAAYDVQQSPPLGFSPLDNQTMTLLWRHFRCAHYVGG